ncbi:hypothetical protein [Hymenobacter sp. BT730]|uniref:hypothetical protein n=1 Tax=Hymenobacter sp. BT730 TaxID=3063332 RepID=UPI0026DFB836|nr:hypothetical protein [Hymenobacter sp. BT730]
MKVHSSFWPPALRALLGPATLAAWLVTYRPAASLASWLLIIGAALAVSYAVAFQDFVHITSRDGILLVTYPFRFSRKTYLLVLAEITALSCQPGWPNVLVFHLGKQVSLRLPFAALSSAAIMTMKKEVMR